MRASGGGGGGGGEGAERRLAASCPGLDGRNRFVVVLEQNVPIIQRSDSISYNVNTHHVQCVWKIGSLWREHAGCTGLSNDLYCAVHAVCVCVCASAIPVTLIET